MPTKILSHLTKGCKCWWHFINIGYKDFLSYSSTKATPCSLPTNEDTIQRFLNLRSNIHYEKKMCFATSLATQFLNCIGHLQLTIFICYECYWTSCKNCNSCNSLYIRCNSLQLNYNFVTTTPFQLLCNSPMIHNVILT